MKGQGHRHYTEAKAHGSVNRTRDVKGVLGTLTRAKRENFSNIVVN